MLPSIAQLTSGNGLTVHCAPQVRTANPYPLDSCTCTYLTRNTKTEHQFTSSSYSGAVNGVGCVSLQVVDIAELLISSALLHVRCQPYNLSHHIATVLLI